jgi:cytochrome c55X
MAPPRSAFGASPPGGRRKRTGRAGSAAAAWVRGATTLIGLVLVAVSAAATELPVSRQHELVRMVRQDCGSCHGMRLTGGLGPALTREAMTDKPVDSMAATIYHGRPGTPMPGWRPMLSEAEARWIAERLIAGFPEEPRR